MLCGGLNGKEIQKEVIYMWMADSLCYTLVTSILLTNYIPIKINLKNHSQSDLDFLLHYPRTPKVQGN